VTGRGRSPLLPYTTLFRSRERRVRDEIRLGVDDVGGRRVRADLRVDARSRADSDDVDAVGRAPDVAVAVRGDDGAGVGRLVELRSEEHTSELQSRVDLVCR